MPARRRNPIVTGFYNPHIAQRLSDNLTCHHFTG
jgi:hypothetical protein